MTVYVLARRFHTSPDDLVVLGVYATRAAAMRAAESVALDQREWECDLESGQWSLGGHGFLPWSGDLTDGLLNSFFWTVTPWAVLDGQIAPGPLTASL